MAQSDVTIFFENLKLWDRPETGQRNQAVLQMEDNVEQLVDDMFEQFCDLQLERPHSRIGNC
jgi:hypothetical protein